MAMTREQVLAQMEADYALMTPDFREEALFVEDGIEWTPTKLITEVRNDSDYGKKYVQSWSQHQENLQKDNEILDLLTALLGGGDQSLMTCGDPNCPNCKGEVRPLLGDTGTEPTKH